MEHLFDQSWEIVPAGGATGEAFVAHHEQHKLFLKRNSSPFLAVLSAEGIVPKLIWTKRLENGDVITAQQWLNGRELTPSDMVDHRVAMMLKKIHQSIPLRGMLERLGKKPLLPEMILKNAEVNLDEETINSSAVQTSLQFLHAEIGNIQYNQQVVCHSDINHNNWLLSNDNQLYLIDWDGAIIADPAIDIGALLYWYIPEQQWESWLELYGMELSDNLILRMKWYVLLQMIMAIQWHKDKGKKDEMNYWINYLHQMNKKL